MCSFKTESWRKRKLLLNTNLILETEMLQIWTFEFWKRCKVLKISKLTWQQVIWVTGRTQDQLHMVNGIKNLKTVSIWVLDILDPTKEKSFHYIAVTYAYEYRGVSDLSLFCARKKCRGDSEYKLMIGRIIPVQTHI